MAACKRNGRWRWAAFVLGTLWLSIGCSPATMSMFLLPFYDDKVPPRCKLSEKKKEITVCIISDFATLETRSDIIPAENELPELLAQQLRKRAKDNKEKLTIISPNRTRSINFVADGRPLRDIAKQFKADYVIALEIQSLSLYEKNSHNMLYRGNADLMVRAVNANLPEGEDTVFSEPYRCEYPGTRGPLDVSEMNLLQFRLRFLNKVAADLARCFVAYPREERIDID